MCDESSSFLWTSRTESKMDGNQVFDPVEQTSVAVVYVEQHMTRMSGWHFCKVTPALLVLRGRTASKDK